MSLFKHFCNFLKLFTTKRSTISPQCQVLKISLQYFGQFLSDQFLLQPN